MGWRETDNYEELGNNFEIDTSGVISNGTINKETQIKNDMPKNTEKQVENKTSENTGVKTQSEIEKNKDSENKDSENKNVEVQNSAPEKYEVKLAVNGIRVDFSEKKIINTADKQWSVGEKKIVSKEQYHQAFRDEICPGPGIYDKSKIIQNVSSIEKADEEGMFRDAGTLLEIMQKNNLPLPGTKTDGNAMQKNNLTLPGTKTDGNAMQNIILRDGTEYKILFTESSEIEPISSADLAAHKEDILNAKDKQDLKDKITEKGNTQKVEKESVEKVNNVRAMQQEQGKESTIEIGSR